MSRYLAIRKWVDNDLGRMGGKPISLLGPLFLGALIFMVAGDGVARLIAMLFVGLPVCAWTVFVLWRSWRLTRAYNIRSARYYERRTRYDLPPEYVDSEAAVTASYRRKKAKF